MAAAGGKDALLSMARMTTAIRTGKGPRWSSLPQNPGLTPDDRKDLQSLQFRYLACGGANLYAYSVLEQQAASGKRDSGRLGLPTSAHAVAWHGAGASSPCRACRLWSPLPFQVYPWRLLQILNGVMTADDLLADAAEGFVAGKSAASQR